LKDAAKVLMEKADVPVVPGYHGVEQGDAHLAAEADRIGFPVLIKAVAGGGGKGMRKVTGSGEFADALESARAEARTAFGNDAVLVEKFVEKPRHIEVQVFGDGEKAVHLFERDCSMQRRHQKVIEEAPAPGMTDEMRSAMGAAAVRAAEAVGYAGAGTVEFIVDASDGLRPDRFWFMEMNTRLQVEHPVTEAITGVDLVEWQLRVAAGEPLPVAQEDLSINGHAIEARLYAEDVAAGFLPATGVLEHLVFPDNARVDTGVRQGDRITPHYDPMIAKVTVHAADRAAALRKMGDALAATEVAGTVTNLAFLGRLVAHRDFAAGDLDTGLIERDLDTLGGDPAPSPGVLAQSAIIAAGLWEARAPMTGFALWTPLDRDIALEPVDVRLTVQGPGNLVAAVDGRQVQCRRTAEGRWFFDGEMAVNWVRHGDRITLFDGTGQIVRIIDPLERADASGPVGSIEAPMPGKVTKVHVAAGDKVTAGQRLVVLEAMKMEHGLRAPRDGVVAEIMAAEGDQVEAGMALVRLEGEPDA
ncbi:MAG: biotin/lipoyl-binding protein, partial [Silicimonas sp.]|nr:biotin/lipoyl-binding protein [Silicimonas sp.]